MKTTTKQTTETETNVLTEMLKNAVINETSKKTLTETEAITLVDKHYEEVSSKNAMLKLVRSLGFSISMSRLFTIYENYTSMKTKLSKVTK